MPSPRLCARTDQTEIAMSEADAPLGPPLSRLGKLISGSAKYMLVPKNAIFYGAKSSEPSSQTY
jgi:hypothetical protein